MNDMRCSLACLTSLLFSSKAQHKKQAKQTNFMAEDLLNTATFGKIFKKKRKKEKKIADCRDFSSTAQNFSLSHERVEYFLC
jgi:hypothetical protein